MSRAPGPISKADQDEVWRHPAPREARCSGQDEIIEFLEDGRAWGNKWRVRRIDTHAASVFLAGDRAWKLKRAVRLPYLDFSTCERRRAALETELELNRRTAPQLYLAVVPVTRNSAGSLRIGGPGQALDWLLEMRRFPDGALLSEIAARGELTHALLGELADRLAAFLATAAERRVPDGASRLRRVIDDNFVAAESHLSIFDAARLARLKLQQCRLLDRHAELLTRRGLRGRIRRGHGDPHLGNIALVDGRPTLFDCLEFDEELATVDTLYELAFLLMDLWRGDLRTEANIVFNRYLDLAADDEEGICLLPLLMSVRAMIRAHVLAADSDRHGGATQQAEEARCYLDLAERLLEPAAIGLIAIGGLSGTGKSTIARALGGTIGRAPGARILRSDVLRKRLAGLPPEASLPPSSYTPASSSVVYAELRRDAERILDHGHSVVADAVFAHADERESIAAVATGHSAEFLGLWLDAPAAVRLSRISARGPDASDATAEVARAQESYEVGALGSWRRVSVAGTIDEAIAAALAARPADFAAKSPVPDD